MDVVLLHNSGAGKDDVSADELTSLLRRGGYNPKYLRLKDELDDPAVLSHGEFVVVAGGDGSVRAAALKLAHSGRTLAPLPLGTANNIASSLGLRGSPAGIIAGWKTPQHRKIDLGLATGPWGQQRFIEGVGVGLVGRAISIIETIADAGSHYYEDRNDELHRDLCVFLALASEMSPVPLSLTIDGRQTGDAFLLLEILNISLAGPRLQLSEDADMTDGFFDVISVPVAHRDKLKERLTKHFADPKTGPLLTSQKARTIRIETSACDLRLDDRLMLRGDEPGAKTSTPITVDLTLEPQALDVLLPAPTI